MHFVIIGSGGAGISAVEAIRSVESGSRITLISKEKVPPYSLCGLPYLLANQMKEKEIFRLGMDFYKKMKVQAALGKEVIKVVPQRNLIILDDNSEVAYDKLLIATGSIPICPSIEGLDREGVFYLSNLEDCKRIKNWIKKGARKAVVIGAGFIGIECATALKKNGLKVTVVEMLKSILPKMLDRDMSMRVQKMLEEKEIDFLLSSQVSKIIGGERVRGVEVGRKLIPCDIVVIGIGVRPNIDLVRDTSIEVNRGIVVDERMRTSVPNIYAAGDVAECMDPLRREKRINAIWPNAVAQGRIAGFNIAGHPRIYQGSNSINILDIFGVSALSIGLLSSEVTSGEERKMERSRYIKKIISQKGKIVGLQFIGTIKNSGYMMSLISRGKDIEEFGEKILEERFLSPLLRT